MKVRITKAGFHTFWYAYKVGEIYEVDTVNPEKFMVRNSNPGFGLCINKSDCEIVKKSKEPKFTIDEDKPASTLAHGGERVAPNHRYCIAGGINCEQFLGRDIRVTKGVACSLANKSGSEIICFEQCPWPSLQKPIEDKYEKAWKIFRKIEGGIRTNCGQMKEEFLQALKGAGL